MNIGSAQSLAALMFLRPSKPSSPGAGLHSLPWWVLLRPCKKLATSCISCSQKTMFFLLAYWMVTGSEWWER